MNKLLRKYILLFFILVVMIMSSQPIINFLFLILFSLCIHSGMKHSFIFNPYFLLSITPFSLLFYNSKYSTFLFPIPIDISFIIFFGILSFYFGLKIFDNKKVFITNDQIQTPNVSNIKLFWFVLILGIIPHVIGFMRVGIPILNLDNLKESKLNYLPSGLSYLIFFLPLTIVISFFERNKKLIFISTLANGLISIVRVAKFDIFVFVIFFLFSYLKYGKSNLSSLKKYVLFIIFFSFIPIVFSWTYDLRNESNIDDSKFLISDFLFADAFTAAISLPYLYLTTAWSNFAYNVENFTEFNYGAYTFYPFISALQIDGSSFYSSTKVIYNYPFNTFAFLTDYYLDFGLLGVLIAPFLLGLFVFYSYKKFITAINPIKDGQYIVLSIATLLLFFSNHFTSVGYPFIVYILFEIVSFSLRFRLIKKQ